MSRKVASKVLPMRVVALADFEALKEEEISFSKGDIFEIRFNDPESGWAYGEKDNKVGWFPMDYVSQLEGQELIKQLTIEVTTSIYLLLFVIINSIYQSIFF